ncbi:MAG: YbhB/YbcL family Raf kinase inhibitor-like protein [Pseudomonas sp.]
MLGRIVGRLLRGFRAGEKTLLWHHPVAVAAPTCIELHSPAFAALTTIPAQHAGLGIGANRSPALAWRGVPEAAVELLLVIEDASAPLPKAFVHAIGIGISAQRCELAEGALNGAGGAVRQLGRNTFGRADYAGPRALPGHGPHRYSWQLFALDSRLDFARPPGREQLISAMAGKVIGRGRLDGIFERV